MTKQIVALVLVLMMFFTCAVSFAEDAPQMNTYKYWEPNWPLATEANPLRISVATVVNSAYYREPEKTWFWNQICQGLFYRFQLQPTSTSKPVATMIISSN